MMIWDLTILYSHRYGDAPTKSVPSGLTAEAATRREFDALSSSVQTAQSIRDLQASMSSLFSAQAIISNDVKLMTEASAQTREDMNVLFLNQQQIMVALKLPTPMLNTSSTSIAAVPAHPVNPSISVIHNNNPKGEKMIGSSGVWNQLSGYSQKSDISRREFWSLRS